MRRCVYLCLTAVMPELTPEIEVEEIPCDKCGYIGFNGRCPYTGSCAARQKQREKTAQESKIHQGQKPAQKYHVPDRGAPCDKCGYIGFNGRCPYTGSCAARQKQREKTAQESKISQEQESAQKRRVLDRVIPCDKCGYIGFNGRCPYTGSCAARQRQKRPAPLLYVSRQDYFRDSRYIR